MKAYKVEPLSKDEQKALHQRLVQENPRNDVSPSHLHWARAGSTYDYNKYCDRTLFRHATNFHDRVETMFNQHEFCVQIKNAGSIPAENLIVEITSSGASIRRHFTIYKLQGPSAPKARSPFDLQMPHFPGFPTPIGRHEMVSRKTQMVGNASKSIVRIFGKVEPGDLPASSQLTLPPISSTSPRE